jgi:hypothetical protein
MKKKVRFSLFNQKKNEWLSVLAKEGQPAFLVRISISDFLIP